MINKRLNDINGRKCSCGKVHSFSSLTLSGKGAIKNLATELKRLGCKMPYVVSDKNTRHIAEGVVKDELTCAEVTPVFYSFDSDELEPDEKTVGSALMHLKAECDSIIAVGSGVINDTCKIISAKVKIPYVIVATAPSMDGYQSMTSSMTMDGLKISLPSRAADVIIGDTDILKSAPAKMLISGVGDMIAKYVSICEWRIANIILGEYYCEDIASLIRAALKKISESKDKIKLCTGDAVEAVFDGLSASSVAMNYAGVSRPASGIEHYISHIYDMRRAEFGTKSEMHGIQCAISTLVAIKLYEKLITVTPCKEKALAYMEKFDKEQWKKELRSLLGGAAESMIALEEKEQKYDKTKHVERLETIIGKWEEIKAVIKEELPSYESLYNFMKDIGAPTSFAEVGMDESILPEALTYAKDIRDKYVLPRLLFDLGIIDEFKNEI